MRRWWRQVMLDRRRAWAVMDARLRVARATLDYWQDQVAKEEDALQRLQAEIDRLRRDYEVTKWTMTQLWSECSPRTYS